MINIKRYIPIIGVMLDQKTVVPIWDDSIIFENSEMYGEILYKKGDHFGKHLKTVDCIFDLKKKTVLLGIPLDYYPKETEFKVGQPVYFESDKYRYLKETKIADIIFEDYTFDIFKGKNVSQWYINNFKDVLFDVNSIYAVKCWKPVYVLENGIKTEYTHKLYHKW